MTQLDLLSYTLTEAELAPPDPPPPAPKEPTGLEAWLTQQASYYLKISNRLMQKNLQSSLKGQPDPLQPVRRHEINRLLTLRTQVLDRLQEVGH